jgi:hypothetical protein
MTFRRRMEEWKCNSTHFYPRHKIETVISLKKLNPRAGVVALEGKISLLLTRVEYTFPASSVLNLVIILG